MAYKGHVSVQRSMKLAAVQAGGRREEGEQMASGKIASELTRVSTD